MGSFLAASAFYNVPVAAVHAAIAEALTRYGVSLTAPAGAADEHNDAMVFEAGAFSIVVWPEYFNLHDVPLVAELSKALGCTAMTSHLYDGDYWTIALCRDGLVLDRFCSHPGYFVHTAAERAPRAARWAGNAAVLGGAFGVSPDAIGPYLRHMDSRPQEPPRTGLLSRLRGQTGSVQPEQPPAGKAFADDAFDLDDPWVFTDLWRRLGAVYPKDMETAKTRLRLQEGFDEKLPIEDDA